MVSLKGYNRVNLWLQWDYGVKEIYCWERGYEKYAEKMRLYRLAWIDNMIEYWKDKP